MYLPANDYTKDLPGEIAVLVAKLDGHLFGSRSMAGKPSKNFSSRMMIGNKIDKTTDYDFAVQYGEWQKDILEKAGFVETDLTYAKDEYITTMYVRDNYQFLLRKKHFFWIRVWDTIDPEFYYHNLWKRGPLLSKMARPEAKELIRIRMNQLYKTAEEIYGVK